MNLNRFFDNDSPFGRIVWRCGVVIGCNLLFVLLSIPIVTAGAGYAAMHYTMLKFMRTKGNIKFFHTWWTGLKGNWKQATAVWLILLALSALLALELYWCSQFTGVMAYFKYGIIALALVELIVGLYTYPTMVAFDAPIKQLVMYGVMFAFQRPVNLLLVLFANVMPLVLTYTIPEHMPTWAFLWCMFGFAAVTLFTDKLLLKQFVPHLPALDAAGDVIAGELMNDPNLVLSHAGGLNTDNSDEARDLAEMTKYGL